MTLHLAPEIRLYGGLTVLECNQKRFILYWLIDYCKLISNNDILGKKAQSTSKNGALPFVLVEIIGETGEEALLMMYMTMIHIICLQNRRYQVLLTLMLSSQTFYHVTTEAMIRLQQHGCTPANILATSNADLSNLIFPVRFHRVQYNEQVKVYLPEI